MSSLPSHTSNSCEPHQHYLQNIFFSQYHHSSRNYHLLSKLLMDFSDLTLSPKICFQGDVLDTDILYVFLAQNSSVVSSHRLSKIDFSSQPMMTFKLQSLVISPRFSFYSLPCSLYISLPAIPQTSPLFPSELLPLPGICPHLPTPSPSVACFLTPFRFVFKCHLFKEMLFSYSV